MAINLGRWFRDRKKQAEGVVAQANPFDGGKTYNTVINNTPVAKPVQTQVNTAQPGWSVRTQPTQPSWLQKQNDFNTSLSAITAPKPQVAQTPTTFNVAQQPVSKPVAQQPQNNVAKPASQFSDHNKWQIQRLNETTPMVLRDRNKAIADKYNAINNPNKSAANTNIREQFYRDSDNDNLDRILGGRKFNTREEAFKVYRQGLVEQGLGDKLKQANALVSQHNQRLSQSRNITGDPLAPQTKGTYMNNMDVLRMADPRTLQALERRLDSDKATARSGVDQALNNFASGATQTFAKLPVNVVNLGWSLVDTVTPEGSKIDKFAERIKGGAQARAQAIENAYARTGVSQQAGDNPFIAVPASGAGQIASAIATGGTVSGVGVGTDIVSQTQRDMAAHGEYDETKQLLTALPNAVAQGLLEKYGVDNLATPAGKSFLKSVLFKAASEGAQEGSQEFVGNIAKNTYDKSQGLLDNVLESAGWGTLLGGGTGLALDSPRLAQNIQNAPKLNTGGYIGVGSDSNNIQTGDQVVTDLNIKQDPTYQTLDKRAYEALKNADESTGALKQNYQVEAAELIRQRNEYVENAKAMTAPVQQQSTVAGMIARMRAAKARIKPLDNKGFIAGPLALDFSKAQAEAKAQTPNESKRPIKPAPAKPLSVVDRVNSINETPKAPTKDKVLASLEKQKRDLIDYEARARYETGKEIAQKQKELRKTIKDQWTGQTDIEDLPRSIKGGKLQGSWAGKSFDELAHDLGFESDSALADELFTHTTQEKLSDIREVVEDTIKRGDSPLSNDYKKLLQEIDDRQAELLRYPEGARALENKPSPKMSKAERESLHASAPVGTERKLKVAAPVASKNVPVRKLTQEGDVVTATNVNPDIKATEKRYSIDDNGQMIEDSKGAYRVFNDGEGKITGIRIGKEYHSAKELGDLSDVNDYGSSLATMRRNIERAFGKETGDKLSRFVVDHQQKQATKLIDRQVKLKQGTDALAKELGISFGMGSKRAKQVSASIQDYGEKNITKQDLVKQYGNDMANKIVKADSWFKSQYDQLLDEMNTTLTTYGYDPVQRHKNYYTHFQDQSLWSKVGLKMQEIRSLSSPTMQDSMPAPTRGKIDNRLAGQSEFLLPNKRFNPFALQRKGDTHTSDAFQSFERYLTPTLNNIYMTPSITRARVVSKAVAEQANLAGKDANGVIIQMREWANRLAGKTSRIDRPLVDSKWGNTALRASQWAQRKAGANTIVGNLSTAVMQPVVLTQTTGKFGLKNTLLATVQEMSTAHSKDAPIRQSEFMRRRYADIANTTRGKIDRAADIANTPLKVVEETAARITWNAAHNDALSKGIRGDAAIKYADVQAEKTLSGRSIGERPELFDAKAPGIFTMYQLEVNNYWQQVGKEMTKAQAARTMAASYGFNLLMGAINGRSVGFNPIDAILDSIGMLDDEDEDNVAKAKRIAQRLGGELVDSLPFAGAVGTTVMGEQGWKDLMGKDSTSGRFGFSNAPRTLYENPGMLITPFGYNQARKTIQGLDTWRKGQLESKSGKKLTDVPQTKTNLAKALAFGKSAIPEVSEYYNNIGQKKTNKNATGVAGIRAENERLNEELRKTLSDDDYAISKMSKADRQKVVDMGIKSQADLDGLDNYVRQQKTRLGMTVAKDKKGYYKTNDAEYNAFKDEYNQKIKDGSYSKAQRIKADYTLSKLKVGSNFSKDSRDLYNVSEKALSSWLATEEKGVDKQKLANELIAYDQALYNAGLISRLKYKGGIAAKSSGRGGRRGGGRGRKSSFSMADFTTNPQLQTQTYQNLNKLLAGTTFKGGKKPSKTGKSGKVAQKQIKVNMKA